MEGELAPARSNAVAPSSTTTAPRCAVERVGEHLAVRVGGQDDSPRQPPRQDRSTEKLFAFALVRPHFRNLAADPDRVPLMG